MIDFSSFLGSDFLETSEIVFILYNLFFDGLKTEQKFQLSKLYLTFFQGLSEEQRILIESNSNVNIAKEFADCVNGLIKSKTILHKSNTSKYMSFKKLEESAEIFRLFFTFLQNKEKDPSYYEILKKFYAYFKISIKLLSFKNYLKKDDDTAPPKVDYNIKFSSSEVVNFANENLYFAYSSYLVETKMEKRSLGPSLLKSANNKDKIKEKLIEDAIMVKNKKKNFVLKFEIEIFF